MHPLKVKRFLVGMSQAELAHRVGKSPAWLSLVERGFLKPKPEIVTRLEAEVGKIGENS